MVRENILQNDSDLVVMRSYNIRQSSTTTDQTLTDYPVFRFFFKHVVKTESYANQLLSLGLDDSPQRHLFQVEAGLTDAEEALLKSVASDEDNAIATFDQATSQWRHNIPLGRFRRLPFSNSKLALHSGGRLCRTISMRYKTEWERTGFRRSTYSSG